MTIAELIELLDDGFFQASWDGLHYQLYARKIPSDFFYDYNRIVDLRRNGILDDGAAQQAKAALVAKYERVGD